MSQSFCTRGQAPEDSLTRSAAGCRLQAARRALPAHAYGSGVPQTALSDHQLEPVAPRTSGWVTSIHSPMCCRFRLPDGLRLEHLEGLAQRHKDTMPKDTPFLKMFGSHVDDSQTWDFIAWMRSVTSLPIFVKVWGAPA